MDIKELYHPKVIEWSKNPLGFEKQEQPKVEVKAFNKVCGDKFRLYPETDQNDLLDVHFHGYGCALSKASTSLLIKTVRGKLLEAAVKDIQAFISFIKVEGADSPNPDWELFEPVKRHSSRLKCVLLSWESLLSHLEFEL